MSNAVHLRVLSPALRRVRRPQRLVERALTRYRQMWLLLVSGVFEPVFYLLSIRIGMGRLVGTVEFQGAPIGYADFVAPALLASSAMNGALMEATYNFYEKLRYAKTYDAIVATPMTPADIALGELVWSLMRGLLYATIFTVVLAAMGLSSSVWVVACPLVALLIGAAFGAVGIAICTYLRSWADLEFVTMLTIPMFLFSGSFFPVEQYAPSLRWLVNFSPLYHGVELARAATTGAWEPSAFGHVAVLAAMAAIGLVVAARRIEKLLLK